VLLLGGSFVIGGQRSSTSVPEMAAVPPPSRVLVRLVVVQPGARTVQAAGDFNGWNPGRTPLEPTSNGAWTVTIPLEPGRYEYQFVVDGEQWIADPFAVEQNDDGFGSRNAVIDVRPPSGASL
jgi:1,4-alpha-glucan branching enzyme